MPTPASPPARALLDWYDRHRRTLPWRALPGQKADPYHVWLSEIMLQQTGVSTVIPYYQRFLERFPTVEHLAAADTDAVLTAWSGLGYYSRARNLHRCAQIVAQRGGFPSDPAALRELPGIGAYTAAAIGAIAFGAPVVPVDGNVERVTSRLYAIEAPLPGSRKLLAEHAALLNQDKEARARPSDFAQALFDLGAGLCSPKSPSCVICPWQTPCAARKRGDPASFPRKTAKAARPERYGAHFLLIDADGRILLRRRPPEGLLGGTVELPGTSWENTPWEAEEAMAHAPAFARSTNRRNMPEWVMSGRVKHVFTHFTLYIDVYTLTVARFGTIPPDQGFLTTPEAAHGLALSTLMRKCLVMAEKNAIPDMS